MGAGIRNPALILINPAARHKPLTGFGVWAAPGNLAAQAGVHLPKERAYLEASMGRGLLLWLIGIPLPIILIIWLLGGLN